jgi:MFS family permease
MMFARGPVSFCTLRFLLGVAEAGFLPGIIYYLHDWYPQTERARAVSWFMAAIPLSIVVGGPLSGALLGLDGAIGLAGWQWLFLIEGLPPVILGVVVLFYLCDKPEQARWLRTEEKALLVARIHAEQSAARARHGVDLRQALLHPVVWKLGLIMFACQCGSYGLTFWAPQIVKAVSGLGNFMVGVVTTIPYIAATLAMVLIGASSDRTGERILHLAIPTFIGALGFAAGAYFVSPVPAMIALTVAAVGDLGTRGPFWALPGRFLSGNASAGGIALINTLAAVGGFVGPYMVGFIKDRTGGYAGLLFLAAVLVAGSIGALRLRNVAVLAQPPTETK